MVTEDKKAYMKQYYDANKKRMIQQIMQRQRLVRNSDKHIEGTREKMINDLNNGTRKFIQMRTLAKYNINIDPKTLKYYHDDSSFYNEDLLEDRQKQPLETMTDDMPSSALCDGENETIPEGTITDILDKTALSEEDQATLRSYVDRYKKHKRKKATIRLIKERLV